MAGLDLTQPLLLAAAPRRDQAAATGLALTAARAITSCDIADAIVHLARSDLIRAPRIAWLVDSGLGRPGWMRGANLAREFLVVDRRCGRSGHWASAVDDAGVDCVRRSTNEGAWSTSHLSVDGRASVQLTTRVEPVFSHCLRSKTKPRLIKISIE